MKSGSKNKPGYLTHTWCMHYYYVLRILTLACRGLTRAFLDNPTLITGPLLPLEGERALAHTVAAFSLPTRAAKVKDKTVASTNQHTKGLQETNTT